MNSNNVHRGVCAFRPGMAVRHGDAVGVLRPDLCPSSVEHRLLLAHGGSLVHGVPRVLLSLPNGLFRSGGVLGLRGDVRREAVRSAGDRAAGLHERGDFPRSAAGALCGASL